MSNMINNLKIVAGSNSARLGNEAIDSSLDLAQRAAMMTEAASKLEELFDVLMIDHRNDHNMRDTPARVAKMFVEEVLSGRFQEPPKITEFENAAGTEDLIVTGPIEVRSMCAHHLMPIYGEAYVGVIPSRDGKIIGLSKYDRIVDYFCSRFQIQEELVKQITNFIVETTQPRGVAVRISATHMCKTHRGVRSTRESRMITTSYHGVMEGDRELKQEFQRECVALARSGD